MFLFNAFAFMNYIRELLRKSWKYILLVICIHFVIISKYKHLIIQLLFINVLLKLEKNEWVSLRKIFQWFNVYVDLGFSRILGFMVQFICNVITQFKKQLSYWNEFCVFGNLITFNHRMVHCIMTNSTVSKHNL